MREFNGPGNNGSEIRNGVTLNLKPGDVVVIPAGTGHWFTKIDDHIDYLMVRIDRTRSRRSDEAASKAISRSQPRNSEGRINSQFPPSTQLGGGLSDSRRPIPNFQTPR